MEKIMGIANDGPECIVLDALISAVSTKLRSSNPAVNFNGNFSYVPTTISVSIFLVFLNHLYSYLSKNSNKLSITWNKKQEDQEEDDDDSDDDKDGEEEHYSDSDKEDSSTEQLEKDKENEKHMAEEREKIRKLIIEADNQKNDAVVTNLADMSEEELEEWKNQEWKKFMGSVEEEWQLLNLWIEEQRQNWIDSKDKELENWMNKMENKWMDIDNINKEYQYIFIKSTLKEDDQSKIKEQLKDELKNFIHRDWKKWIRDNESYLNTWLMKQWIQWKNNKILKFLMAEWKHEEDEYWNDWEKTETWKWLHFTKRRKWQTWKNRVTKEKQEWEEWVKIKEQLVIYTKYKKLTQWKNAKKPSINQWVESLADKCINDSRWDTWINEKYNQLVLEQNVDEKEEINEKIKNRTNHKASTFISFKNKLQSVKEEKENVP
ncbi:Tryptophan/threonine-rich antigen [Plasmodium coatneyi]|uniref:Tryptophan/threonine-rich antigen n=1 Tax=Plasmodium coatneyi TaxID=208452 RepID=A0A1B1DVI6_9APIC|nr:Tryptophan/threonine-rich antigen [Plasmodium coatneyi]ANQ06806.1 Tryptophan/threonine-rich antigen [Plasmodium coatneyi]